MRIDADFGLGFDSTSIFLFLALYFFFMLLLGSKVGTVSSFKPLAGALKNFMVPKIRKY